MLSILFSFFFYANYGQSAPFSQSCPEIGGVHAQPGCVAVAMAHVMAHNAFPTSCEGAVSYTSPSHRISVKEDFSSVSFDWQRLRNPSSAADTLEIARMLYLCGAAARTDYRIQNSTASFPSMLSALVKNFHYDPDMAIYSRECYDRATWHSILMNELDEGRQVIMQANDISQGSHAFVIDGYQILSSDTLFHVNWGWEGLYNGYYNIDRLNPGNYLFSEERRIVVSCQPDDEVQKVKQYLECRVTLSDTVVIPGQNGVRADIDVVNRAYRNFNGSYIVYLVDDKGVRTKISRKEYTGDMQTNYSHSSSFTFTSPDVPGRYTLVLEASPYATYTYFTPLAFGDTTLDVNDASAIQSLTVEPADDDRAYDPSGSRMITPQGVVIKKGRKYHVLKK